MSSAFSDFSRKRDVVYPFLETYCSRGFFFTMSGVIVTVMSCSPWNLCIGGGICSVFMKKLQKYLFRASTFTLC